MAKSQRLRDGERWVDCEATRRLYEEAKNRIPGLYRLLDEAGFGSGALSRLRGTDKRGHKPMSVTKMQLNSVKTFARTSGIPIEQLLTEGTGLHFSGDSVATTSSVPAAVNLEGKSEAQTKHDRDVVNLRWFFRHMSVDLLGMHISEMPDRLHYFAPVMHDDLSAILRNPSFRLYDNALEKSLCGLVSELGKTLAHDGHYRELNNLWVQAFGTHGLHVDYNAERAVAAEIQESAASLACTLDLVIEMVRNNYIEVDLDDLSQKFSRDYKAIIKRK